MVCFFYVNMAGEIYFLIAVSASVLETFPIKVFLSKYYVKFLFQITFGRVRVYEKVYCCFVNHVYSFIVYCF